MHHPGDPAPRPLVALTRSAEDNASLGAQLEARGLGWLDLPCLATEARRPPEARLAALRTEGPFAAVAFPSKRAVAALLDAPDLVASLGLAPDASLLVAAVGPATAEALRSRGWPVQVEPEDKTGAALAEALAARLAPGARVLLPGGDRARPELPAGLAARGLAPVPLEVYAHGPAPAPKAPVRPDAVICASPSAAEAFLDANPDLVDAPFVAIGPTTEAALARLGARRILRAAGPSGEALVEATLAALGRTTPGGADGIDALGAPTPTSTNTPTGEDR